MARITTKDCEQVVPNRFELVMLAARRAHDLCAGAEPQIETDDENPTVVALREIAARKVDPASLRQKLIERFMTSDTDAIDFGEAPDRAPASNSPMPDDPEPSDGGAPAQVNYH